MYDLIGDIHGHADALEALLHALDYRESAGVYGHASRQVIFLGDFIDRGPKIPRVLEIARSMVETGSALAVMGNHELNALAFHTEYASKPGVYLRKRTNSNIRQHAQTVLQLEEEELAVALAWFRTLPMWLDLDGLRAIHACWDEVAIRQVESGLAQYGGVTAALLHSACLPGGELFVPVEILLKGKEISLPDGLHILDKEGIRRDKIRTRWYLPAEGLSYSEYALQSAPVECEAKLLADIVQQAVPYPTTAKPVFLGHYWLSNREPDLLASNVACLDFSVANGGYLCAYRWDGEQQLSHEKFVWVR